jgi:hypothetical protein
MANGVACRAHAPNIEPTCAMCMEGTIMTVVEDRGSEYGDFRSMAVITQRLERVVQDANSYANLSDMHKESLHMIFHKIARIVNGNPNNKDSWLDIEGYARIVRTRL